MRRERGPRNTLTPISALSGGNSRKTHKFPWSPWRLIDTLAIRIHPNSFGISTNSSPNRHASGPHPFAYDLSLAASIVEACPPAVWRALAAVAANRGSAIRIHRNPLKSNHIQNSNRRKTAPFEILFSSVGFACTHDAAPRSIPISTRHIPIVESTANAAISTTSNFLLVTHSHFSLSRTSGTSRNWNHTAESLPSDPAAALTPIARACPSAPRLCSGRERRAPLGTIWRLQLTDSPPDCYPESSRIMSPTEEYAWQLQ